MMIYISCAKTMTARSRQQVPYTTVPYFEKEAHENAMHMAQFSTEELTRLLRINNKLAAENVLRYHDFLSPDAPSLPALLAYTGIVFKRLNPKDFTEEDWKYAQQHLFITSFLYGLLRPLDLIKNYRLEGDVRMPEHDVRILATFADRIFHNRNKKTGKSPDKSGKRRNEGSVPLERGYSSCRSCNTGVHGIQEWQTYDSSYLC